MALLLRAHDATSSPRSLHARICALACLIALTFSVLAPTAAAALTDPAIQATSALLIEPTSGTVLYELNADETRYPASTTKIMTALVTLENADLTQQITVEEGDFTHVTADSSVAGFKPGEVLTVEQLLYGLMLPSGNDASYILARAVAGDVDTFVQMMNDRAAEVGCTGTHFANPCGLHDDNHYTTARDLMRITQAAMANPTFAQIVSTPSYELPATNLQEARTLENSNLLLDSTSSVYYAPTQGIKTGNTTEAGRCLVAAASQNDITLYSVVLGCADAEIPASLTETKRLFEWAYAEWSVQEIVTAGTTLQSVDVVDAHQDKQLQITADGTIAKLLPNDTDHAAITVSFDLPEEFCAPYTQGDVIGTATYTLNGELLGKVTLSAGNDVELSALAQIRNFALGVITNPITWIVLGVFVVLIIVSIVRGWRRRRSSSQPLHHRSPSQPLNSTPPRSRGTHFK